MAPSRFRSREGVLASADDRVVQLKFINLQDEQELICLYAHPCVLSTWSHVLSSVIEDAQPSQHPDVAAAASSSSCSSSRLYQQTIPLDDTDTAAWEDALSLMYPSVPLFEISWSNAAGLLMLADKYDMPCLTEHVKAFLNAPQQAFATVTADTADDDNPLATAGPTRLQAHLTDGSWPNLPDVFEWLQITSKCGLDQHAAICIQHIVENRLQIPPGVIGSVRAEHAEQLLWQLQEVLQAAALPFSGFVCSSCRKQWYMRGGGCFACACLHCGCTHCEKGQVGEQLSDGEQEGENVNGYEDGDGMEAEDESSDDEDESSDDEETSDEEDGNVEDD